MAQTTQDREASQTTPSGGASQDHPGTATEPQQKKKEPAGVLTESELIVETGHEDHVHDVQWDFYGRRIATGSSDRTVKIFEVTSETTSAHVATLTGHDGPVWEVGWAHPTYGSCVASCSYDGTVLVFQEQPNGEWPVVHKWAASGALTNKATQQQNGNTNGGPLASGDAAGLSSQTSKTPSSVNSIEFAPIEHGALMLACASSDGHVAVLVHHGAPDASPNDDVWTTHRFLASRAGCNAVTWGPVGAVGAKKNGVDTVDALRLATGSCDNRVAFWRAKVPDGGLSALATAGGEPPNQPGGISMTAQRPPSANETPSSNETGFATLEFGEEPSQNDGKAHSDWVRDVAWAPFNAIPTSLVASCSQDKTVRVWTLHTADGIWEHKLVNAFDAPVWRVHWSVAGNILAVSAGDDDVSLWKEDPNYEWHKLGMNEPTVSHGPGSGGAPADSSAGAAPPAAPPRGPP